MPLSHCAAISLTHGGPPVTPPARKGFGATLIENIVKGSKGRLDYQPTGLVCVLELPA